MGVDANNEKALRVYIFWANDGFMAGLREEGRDDEKGFGYEGCEYHAQSIGKRGWILKESRNSWRSILFCDYSHHHLSKHSNQASKSFIPTFDNAC